MKLQELLEEYRDSLPSESVPAFDELLKQQKRRQTRRIWLSAGLAAAACLMAVLGWNARQRPIAVVPVPVVAKVPAPVEVEVVSAVPDPLVKRAVKKRPKAVDEVSGFVAIAENSMLPQPAMFQVLRVSVSGQRLAALGVLRPDQFVRPTMTADVLLGDDGMARAVRVVANE
jgi:hypothetical protein